MIGVLAAAVDYRCVCNARLEQEEERRKARSLRNQNPYLYDLFEKKAAERRKNRKQSQKNIKMIENSKIEIVGNGVANILTNIYSWSKKTAWKAVSFPCSIFKALRSGSA